MFLSEMTITHFKSHDF